MRVLIGVHHFPPRHRGGAERQAWRYASGLRRRGHEARVVCVERIDTGPADGVTWTDDVYDGIPVRRLSFDLRRAPDRFRWEYDNPWVGRHLAELIAAERPDLFFLVSGYLLTGSALRAARDAGVPSIVVLTDFWFLCPRITLLRSNGELSPPPIDPATCARCLAEEQRRYRIPGRLAPRLMALYWKARRDRAAPIRARLDSLRAALGHAEAILSPSQFLRDVYVAAGTGPTQIQVVRQGVEVPATRLPLPPAPPVRLGYFGQIAPLKGVDVLVRAVRSRPAAAIEVKIYGDASHHPAYAARLRELIGGDVRIEMCGTFQERGSFDEALRPLHATVVPSIWYENSPNAILEPFAHGVPVLTSDLGGMAELVRHEKSGLLFRPGDPDSLGEQIDRLLREPGLLAGLRAGVPEVKSIEQEIVEIEALAERVVRDRPSTTG